MRERVTAAGHLDRSRLFLGLVLACEDRWVDEPGDEYTVEVDLVWEYTWSIDGGPQPALGGTTTGESFPYAVGELHAVGTSQAS